MAWLDGPQRKTEPNALIAEVAVEVDLEGRPGVPRPVAPRADAQGAGILGTPRYSIN